MPTAIRSRPAPIPSLRSPCFDRVGCPRAGIRQQAGDQTNPARAKKSHAWESTKKWSLRSVQDSKSRESSYGGFEAHQCSGRDSAQIFKRSAHRLKSIALRNWGRYSQLCRHSENFGFVGQGQPRSINSVELRGVSRKGYAGSLGRATVASSDYAGRRRSSGHRA